MEPFSMGKKKRRRDVVFQLNGELRELDQNSVSRIFTFGKLMQICNQTLHKMENIDFCHTK